MINFFKTYKILVLILQRSLVILMLDHMVVRRHIVSRRKPYWLLNKYVYPSSSNSGPTHILSQSSSCIDLIFTDQPHLVIDCGIHASLHPSCHHQITYCKLNLKITYPSPYKCLIWDYKKANSFCIKKHFEQLIGMSSFI